ncbi:MAG: stage II sporulation protein P, partial [Clostridia bacterium]|nr:stage II sporulation protein P [Clostridia bacterium]
MYRTKRRNRKHHFFSRTIVVRKAPSWIFPVGFMFGLLAIILASFLHLPTVLMECADTNFLLSCFQASAPYLCGTHLDISVNPTYQMLDLTLPMIRSNESMAKKYSALFDTSIRLTRQAPIKKEETKVGNIPVQTIDLSSKKGITFSNATSYAVNADELIKTPLLFSSAKELPRVLIVHTHASEAYAESAGGRSKNEAENVIRIGKEIADTLNQNGIITVHDKTKNDEPDY